MNRVKDYVRLRYLTSVKVKLANLPVGTSPMNFFRLLSPDSSILSPRSIIQFDDRLTWL